MSDKLLGDEQEQGIVASYNTKTGEIVGVLPGESGKRDNATQTADQSKPPLHVVEEGQDIGVVANYDKGTGEIVGVLPGEHGDPSKDDDLAL